MPSMVTYLADGVDFFSSSEHDVLFDYGPLVDRLGCPGNRFLHQLDDQIVMPGDQLNACSIEDQQIGLDLRLQFAASVRCMAIGPMP